jgi:ribosomal protein S18 acetylase RimI-like enzyme
MSVPERAWRFDSEVQERCAGRIQRFAQGVALYADDLPRVYDANLVRVDRPEGLSAADLELLAESLQAGLGHRKLMLPGGLLSERLARELGARKWSVSRTVVMEYTGPPERDPERAAAAEQVDPRAIRGARTDASAQRSTDVQRQVADYTERLGRAGNGRIFAAFADREVGGFCTLLEGDGIGEIDEVTTLERHQRRGLGTAVVEAALSASLAAGHDVTFVVAADDDWPKDWYARLGFQTVGDRWEIWKV